MFSGTFERGRLRKIYTMTDLIVYFLIFCTLFLMGFLFLIRLLIIHGRALSRSYEMVKKELRVSANKRKKAKMEVHMAEKEPLKVNSNGKSTDTMLSAKQVDMVMHKVNEYMKSERPYLDPKFNMNKLCEGIGMNRTYLSLAINTKTGQRFETYINRFRIRDAVELLMEEESSQYTLEYLASRVGFHSKSTFNRSFKQFTGINPSSFQRSIPAEIDTFEKFLEQFDQIKEHSFTTQ